MVKILIRDAQVLCTPPIGFSTVVAEQLDKALAARLRFDPNRMRVARIGARFRPHEILVLWALLPLDGAGFHPEGKTCQRFVCEAVALQG